MILNRFFTLSLLVVLSSTGFGLVTTSDVDDIAGVLNYLFGHQKVRPDGLPADPRTIIKLEEKTSNPTRITVGLKTSILGALEGELKTEVEYEKDFLCFDLDFCRRGKCRRDSPESGRDLLF